MRMLTMLGMLALAACTHPETRPTTEPEAFRAMLGDVQEVMVDRDCRDVHVPGFVRREWYR